MDRKLTKQMMDEIMKSGKLDEFLVENEENFIKLDLSKYLLKLINDKNSTPAKVIKKAAIEKSYLYQILNGKRKPGRDKLIRISIALELDIEETQRLLKVAGKGILYPKEMRDSVLIYCIKKKYDIDKTQILLDEFGKGTLD